MDNILSLFLGVAIGAYYAESIRTQVPVLTPSSSTDANQNGGG